MIDAVAFAEGMGRLAGAFGREADGPVSALYFRLLGPHLAAAEWLALVDKVAALERFWPSPAVMLEHAGIDVHSHSEGALRTVADALFAHGGYRFLPAEVSTSWDAATWAGIRAIGGLKEITLCTEDRWPKLQARFRKAYQEALAVRPALPSGETPQPATLKLVRELAGDRALPRGDR